MSNVADSDPSEAALSSAAATTAAAEAAANASADDDGDDGNGGGDGWSLNHQCRSDAHAVNDSMTIDRRRLMIKALWTLFCRCADTYADKVRQFPERDNF